MSFKLLRIENSDFAIADPEELLLKDLQSGLDLVGECMSHGLSGILIYKDKIHPGFFDLRTRIAGEVLQKFSTYHLRIAIIGDFSEVTSQSLKDFIRESNKTGRILFVATVDEAMNRFLQR